MQNRHIFQHIHVHTHTHTIHVQFGTETTRQCNKQIQFVCTQVLNLVEQKQFVALAVALKLFWKNDWNWRRNDAHCSMRKRHPTIVLQCISIDTCICLLPAPNTIFIKMVLLNFSLTIWWYTRELVKCQNWECFNVSMVECLNVGMLVCYYVCMFLGLFQCWCILSHVHDIWSQHQFPNSSDAHASGIWFVCDALFL